MCLSACTDTMFRGYVIVGCTRRNGHVGADAGECFPGHGLRVSHNLVGTGRYLPHGHRNTTSALLTS